MRVLQPTLAFQEKCFILLICVHCQNFRHLVGTFQRCRTAKGDTAVSDKENILQVILQVS